MEEFLSVYTRIENPTWEMIGFSFILSLLLSSMIAITYHNTTQNAIRHFGMLQTLIAGSMVATMILQAIGNNIASGLGMLGALTIIQFRVNFKNPRDIIFVFASLGAGITCGLYGFVIAVFGTFLFCILSYVIRYSPFHFSNLIDWDVKLRAEEHVRMSPQFEAIMNKYCVFWGLESLSLVKKQAPAPVPAGAYNMTPPKPKDLMNYEYNLRFRENVKNEDFIESIQNLDMTLLSLKKNSNA